MNTSITKGIHHLGLTVSSLEQSADFFVRLLGWQIVRRNNDYPAIYLSDGSMMLTLWATKQEPYIIFNKNSNIGLHHVAFTVGSEADLQRIHQSLLQHGINIEFAPEQLGNGPAKHMICFEPSGIRVEFIWPGK